MWCVCDTIDIAFVVSREKTTVLSTLEPQAVAGTTMPTLSDTPRLLYLTLPPDSQLYLCFVVSVSP